MNPYRPNCLNGDYSIGCKLLEKCYSSLFQSFYSLATSKSPDPKEEESAKPLPTPKPQPAPKPQSAPKQGNAFAVMMQSAKNPKSQSHQEKKEEPQKKAAQGGWANALASYILHPEQHTNDIYFKDDDVMVWRTYSPLNLEGDSR